ncbi:hypothetical protein [Longispora fulva]|uniref:Tetrahydromethanopterin S-methyltransferase subunit B n=1 Tax=Longispora fulva TaxID=619741 RepID=A0A8J7GY17_9ACTN|nr:hypothetical protein [Longispora fulva]MBG6140206.1 tetrahydromethanopterin S-methyltransferase subunit B [Longispora fulva]
MTASAAGAHRLPGAARFVVGLLCTALPAHFRARQRAEWTADLMQITGPARWRYLFGAAWTLPALRLLARRARTDGSGIVAPAGPLVALTARTLLVGLGWAVLCWVVMLPGRYLVLDIPARMASGAQFDPKWVWPMSDMPALLPAQIALYWGGMAASMDFPFVFGLTLIALVVIALERGLPWRERLWVAAPRMAVVAFAGIVMTVADAFLAMVVGLGVGLGLAALVALWLGSAGHGLSTGRRVGLRVLGLAALAVLIVNQTVGHAVVVWFMD